MNIKALIASAAETIIKVVLLAFAVSIILKGITQAYEFGYKVFADEPMSVNNPRTISVGIAENESVSDVAKMLEEKGLIADAKLFRVQELLSAYHDQIKPGYYDLSTGMTAAEMLRVMSGEQTDEEGAESAVSTPVTPAGEEYDPGEAEEYNSGFIDEIEAGVAEEGLPEEAPEGEGE
ncbi:MAG: endolytic transglycosylase MltG [Lachnospiraceae bacterium]|nr:endolytic transglycosylase MltG [Lachnospiraceae bacterium]